MSNQPSPTSVLLVAALSVPGAVSAADLANGASVYAGTCIACHGPEGKGALPGMPNLKDSEGALAQDTQVLEARVLEGFESPGSTFAMPPRGGNPTLSASDVADVVAYMRASFLGLER